ncbi:GntR family transcriptional regulator [Pseudomonas sp. R2.Fl]|nr:GntR family transcriptional regulator [Pseudomonas sp. R2.Fl]
MSTSVPQLKYDVAITTVRKQVEDHLRRAITQGLFAPGQHLSDRVLQSTFNVSRTVVREAVRQLEAEGLIETVPHRGSFVRSVSLEEVRQIYDVRAVLEALASKGFARNASPEQIEELAAVMDEVRALIDAPQADALIDLKHKFYAILMDGCGNTYVEQMLGQILNRNMQLRRTSLSAPGRLPHTVAELDQLVDAIRRRDEQGAWDATIKHVRNAADVALDVLSRQAAAREGGQSHPEKVEGYE